MNIGADRQTDRQESRLGVIKPQRLQITNSIHEKNKLHSSTWQVRRLHSLLCFGALFCIIPHWEQGLIIIPTTKRYAFSQFLLYYREGYQNIKGDY